MAASIIYIKVSDLPNHFVAICSDILITINFAFHKGYLPDFLNKKVRDLSQYKKKCIFYLSYCVHAP
jgi:hypothetical protein